MRILLCSDGSPQAEGAVEFGGMLAAAFGEGQDTMLVGISETAQEAPELTASLLRSQERLAARGLQASLLTKTGSPIASLVQLAEDYDLVVIGGMRQPGPLARPAKVYTLIRQASSAILLVGEPRPQLERILVCTAGGYKGRRAVRFTANIARATGASVQLFHVMAEPPHVFEDMEDEEDVERFLHEKTALARSLERQRDILAAAGVPHQLRLRYGLVVEEVVEELEAGDFDLVVTGTHPTGEGLLADWMMGDMTKALVEQVDRPILIVRTAGRAESWLRNLARRVLPAGWLKRK